MNSPRTVHAGLCIALSVMLIWNTKAGEKADIPPATAIAKSKKVAGSTSPAAVALEGVKPTWYPLISLKTTPVSGWNRSGDSAGKVGTGSVVRRYEWGVTKVVGNVWGGEARVWTSSYLVPVSAGRVGERAAGIRRARVGLGTTNLGMGGSGLSENGANVPAAPTGLRVGAGP